MSILQLKKTKLRLPSIGIPYDGVEDVELRPLLKGDQKAISVASNNIYSVFKSLLERILVNNKIDLDTMLLTDCSAILFGVRIISFGNEYRFNYQCDNCGKRNSAVTYLNELSVIYADELESEFKTTDLDFELSDGNKVKFHLPTLGDERIIAAQVKNIIKRNSEAESSIRYYENLVRLAQLLDHVESLGANQTLPARIKFLDEEISMADEKRLWQEINNKDIGIVNELESSCQYCGYDNDLTISLDSNFFRPSN